MQARGMMALRLRLSRSLVVGRVGASARSAGRAFWPRLRETFGPGCMQAHRMIALHSGGNTGNHGFISRTFVFKARCFDIKTLCFTFKARRFGFKSRWIKIKVRWFEINPLCFDTKVPCFARHWFATLQS